MLVSRADSCRVLQLNADLRITFSTGRLDSCHCEFANYALQLKVPRTSSGYLKAV